MARELIDSRLIGVFGVVLVMASVSCSASRPEGAELPAPALQGHVRSSTGTALAGVAIRATALGKNLTISIFTDRNGRYAYKDLPEGTYGVHVAAAGFEPIKKEDVRVGAKETPNLDFTLQSRPLQYDELSTTELLMSLSGTKEQKDQFASCSNCHTLQFVVSRGKRDRQRWLSTIEKMRGINTNGTLLSDVRAQAAVVRSREANNRLADYLAEVLGPDSPEISFK